MAKVIKYKSHSVSTYLIGLTQQWLKSENIKATQCSVDLFNWASRDRFGQFAYHINLLHSLCLQIKLLSAQHPLLRWSGLVTVFQAQAPWLVSRYFDWISPTRCLTVMIYQSWTRGSSLEHSSRDLLQNFTNLKSVYVQPISIVRGQKAQGKVTV